MEMKSEVIYGKYYQRSKNQPQQLGNGYLSKKVTYKYL